MAQVKTGLVSVTFRQKSVEEIAALTAEAGLSGVEWGGDVHVPPGDREAARRAAQLTRQAGLEVLSYGSYYRCQPGEDFTPVLESALALGAPRIRVWAGTKPWEEASPQEREAQTAQMVGCVEELAGLALDYGVSLVMEEYDNELSPIATMEGVRRFLDGCPALSCAFDTGNFRFANQAVGDAYQLLRDRIGHVHLKDRSYTQHNGEDAKTALDGVNLYPAPVGGGDLPLEDILTQLKRDGYDGIYTIEYYGANHALEYLKDSVAWVQARLG